MYTQCPRCLTVYQPTAAQLASGRGQLRCGVCETIFDALERLSDDTIDRAMPALPAASIAPRVAADIPPRQEQLFQPDQSIAPPGFIAASGAAKPRGAAVWWSISFLTLLLFAQAVLAERDRLAADPRWRPWIVRVADALRLPLAPLHAPQEIALTARDVRAHPSVPDALLIDASFRNDAAFPQAWPLLELRLLDLDGKEIGLRRFRVEEYLGASPRAAALAAGQSAHITIELADPGKQAIAFAFDFL